jgi:hypothetical protein
MRFETIEDLLFDAVSQTCSCSKLGAKRDCLMCDDQQCVRRQIAKRVTKILMQENITIPSENDLKTILFEFAIFFDLSEISPRFVHL